MESAAAQIIALGTLCLLGVGLGILAAVRVRRSPFTSVQAAVYALLYLIVRVQWRTQIHGRVSISRGQGAVIVCNHLGPLDSFPVALCVDRLVHWMVAEEYCLHPLMRWFFWLCEAIPVSRRGIDTAATKLAIRYAQEGHVVGLFPEGRINTSDELLGPGRPGAAMIALKARVPVVPCYISGSPYDGTALGCLLMASKIRLKVGRPIDLSAYYDRDDDRTVLEELTKRFLVEMARLAGCSDYEPKLAGRFYKPGMNRETA
jgi:1-acyl-sn-glycerol-3-phosphate acyltransferase